MTAPNWRETPPTDIPKTLEPWLTHEGSLTQALIQTAHHFSVHLIDFSTRNTCEDEAICFEHAANMPKICRQVALCLDETPVIYAVSLCEENDQFWGNVLNRGTRPLGWTLFDPNAAITRSPLEFSTLKCPDIRANAAALCAPKDSQFLTRRAVFYAPDTHSPLLLQELILPNLANFTLNP